MGFTPIPTLRVPPRILQLRARRVGVPLCSTTGTPRFSRGSNLLPRSELLKVAVRNEVAKDVAARVLDATERAMKLRDMEITDFLRAPERIGMTNVLSKLADIQVLGYGGYPQAERQKLVVGITDIGLPTTLPLDSENAFTSRIEDSIRLVEFRGNFLFDPASHRDFLGAVLGLGIERSRLGDLVVLGDRGAQLLCDAELAQFIADSVSQVRSVPVKGHIVNLSDLEVREPLKKAMQSVEASMRVDAVASAGFSLSRTKMADLVKKGDVSVNYREISSGSKELKAGDTVTIRGKGRLEIEEATKTAKGRHRVKMMRFY